MIITPQKIIKIVIMKIINNKSNYVNNIVNNLLSDMIYIGVGFMHVRKCVCIR